MNNDFLDTNLLVYAYSKTELNKADRANELLFQSNSLISSQVINEFANVCLRKLHQPEQSIIAAIHEIARSIRIVGFSLSTQLQALRISQKYGFSYYDALVIATALENNCKSLFTEDMQHNQIIEAQLRIINPFL